VDTKTPSWQRSFRTRPHRKESAMSALRAAGICFLASNLRCFVPGEHRASKQLNDWSCDGLSPKMRRKESSVCRPEHESEFLQARGPGR
jgi:hypothetical protein